MARYADGSYSSAAGVALIAKVLAGRCTMHYTRVAVGKGEIPEDKTPKTMTEPADYVMDARIASVTNPVNGECQVTVQINSSDVEQGFYCTGLLLYAEDPDDGEVPYTYLVLENGPEWIRPSSAAVGKLATFDLIAAVGDVDVVTAAIDPDSIMSYEAVKELIENETKNIGGIVYTIPFTVSPADWVNDGDGTHPAYADIVDARIKASHVPAVVFDDDSLDTTADCGVSTTSESYSGYVRIKAKTAATANLTGTLYLIGKAAGSGGGGDYELPIATDTTLGGVKIKDGGGLKIDGLGNLELDAATGQDVHDLYDDTGE